MNVYPVTLSALLQYLQTVAGQRWLLAWSAVCLVFYVYHRYRMNWMKTEHVRMFERLQRSDDQVSQLRRDFQVAREENRLLWSLLPQRNAMQTADAVLRGFSPLRSDGVAMIVQIVGDEQQVVLSRGLSSGGPQRVVLPAELLARFAAEPYLLLEGEQLQASGLPSVLFPHESGKVSRLVVATAVDGGAPSCILFATEGVPGSGTLEQQRRLACRIVRFLDQKLRQERSAEIQNNQLRLTTYMLQLRSVADQESEEPMTMIRNYISSLMHLLHGDRMAFFPGAGRVDDTTNVVRCGETPPPGVETQWRKHEQRLIEDASADGKPKAYARNDLERLGVDSLIGAAMVIPLVKDDRVIAELCCSRRRTVAFAPQERDLAAWAAEDFAHAMYRHLSHFATAQQARRDPLTDLANRREFDRRIEDEFQRARRAVHPCSLLMLDLDHFKDVNDTYGHQAGDFILQEAARRLRENVIDIVRDQDRILLARYGGEEIAVLMRQVPEDRAREIAEALRSAIESSRFVSRGLQIDVTVSIGAATYPDHGTTVGEWIAAADEALYAAKQAGRNRVVTASDLVELPPTLRS